MQRTAAQGGRVSGSLMGGGLIDDDSDEGSLGGDESDGSTQVSVNDNGMGGPGFIQDEEDLSDLDEASSDNEF